MNWHWDLWLIFGFAGQFLFAGRFLVQWISSERKRESHVPIAFWYFSLAGGLVMTAYAIHRRDPVFIIGQGSGLIVYIRNLMLIHRQPQRETHVDPAATPAAPPDRA
ncbi:MAG: lipid-A-disaccharide synthase N-terminal domain-containing protein [Acidobacteria bacterium]|nr:lipid-A-disaccharide synthase N-terminal domain-containing protein [Acidobacteriota bacterium]MBV9478209.1 lipid-A-disaccharide synthase N-terminal domain-containing protein [Acidobacteriota bacterium]